MDDVGLRQRRGGPAADGLSAIHTTTSSGSAVAAPPSPLGTVAAAFRNSKGNELRTFAARIIRAAGFSVDEVHSGSGEYTVLLITLPIKALVQTAEELGLRKRDLEGTVRTFTADIAGAFAVGTGPSDLFSQSELLLLTEYRLDVIKPDKVKFDDVKGNESLLEWCKRQKYLEDVFPLHDKEAAESILKELSFKSPTFDVGGISKIQDYFGDKVALYFAFLTFYTKSLMTYAGAGIAVFVLSTAVPSTAPLLLFVYSIFATLWGASMTSLWKRRNIEVVYMWTSLIMGDSADESLMSMSQKEDLRNEFQGEEVSHRITGEKIVVYPKRKKVTMYFVSTFVVCACLYISCKAMLAALDVEDIIGTWLDAHADEHSWSRPFIMRGIVLKNIPLVVYLGSLNILDTIYGMVATKLTDLENHKYHSQYENSHVLKLVLFQFLNMNMAYLHVAFIRRDYARLAASIRSILFTELLIGNVKEVLIPIFMSQRKKKAKMAAAVEKMKEENPDLEESECVVDPATLDNPIDEQLEMEEDDGVFGDYFELVRQFSQISLFAAAFPLGALLALLNNLMEVYSDMYKMVNMTRRTSPKRALNIGAWLHAFEFISIMSVMTNLGIITVTAGYADVVVGKGISKTQEYFWMIVIEHLLLVARFAFMTLFEGIPSWVRDQRAKERFLASKKASTRAGPAASSSSAPSETSVAHDNAAIA
jgi:anoctamin-10